ncbi:MAG: glutamate--tRNA ligase [bacterium]|nr:glutamate--tRNA ligase [bacterium]
MQEKSENKPKVRVRFPPSPTGFLHVGSARTALYNFLFAKSNNGQLILRIEDTDEARNNADGEADIFESLKWLGISWDEGPDIGGPSKSYKQSERAEIYELAVKKLLSTGKAYRCFCSQERLDKLRDECEAVKMPFKYDNKCRGISLEESEKKGKVDNFVVRLKINEGEEVIINDLVRGKVRFAPGAVDDFVLSKGTNKALYHLAVVVDDYEMKITHIIRGEDGLSNTPKHVFLQRALGYQTPIYAHLPLLLDEQKKKLSKRSGDVSLFVKTLREEEGYLPEAIINGLALLGWNSKTEQDLFTLEELKNVFKLENVQKAGAVFSLDRLNWLNKQHIRKLSVEVLRERVKPFMDKVGVKVADDYLMRLIQIERERITLLKEVPGLVLDTISNPVLDSEKIAWKKDDKNIAKDALEFLLDKMGQLSAETWSDFEMLQSSIMKIVDKSEKGRATMLWPMRYALSGKEKSAGPQELAWLLGKDETIKRMREAVVQLGPGNK